MNSSGRLYIVSHFSDPYEVVLKDEVLRREKQKEDLAYWMQYHELCHARVFEVLKGEAAVSLIVRSYMDAEINCECKESNMWTFKKEAFDKALKWVRGGVSLSPYQQTTRTALWEIIRHMGETPFCIHTAQRRLEHAEASTMVYEFKESNKRTERKLEEEEEFEEEYFSISRKIEHYLDLMMVMNLVTPPIGRISPAWSCRHEDGSGHKRPIHIRPPEEFDALYVPVSPDLIRLPSSLAYEKQLRLALEDYLELPDPSDYGLSDVKLGLSVMESRKKAKTQLAISPSSSSSSSPSSSSSSTLSSSSDSPPDTDIQSILDFIRSLKRISTADEVFNLPKPIVIICGSTGEERELKSVLTRRDLKPSEIMYINIKDKLRSRRGISGKSIVISQFVELNNEFIQMILVPLMSVTYRLLDWMPISK
jgi:hypothetical protein